MGEADNTLSMIYAHPPLVMNRFPLQGDSDDIGTQGTLTAVHEKYHAL
jgi:hypothetical protein